MKVPSHPDHYNLEGCRVNATSLVFGTLKTLKTTFNTKRWTSLISGEFIDQSGTDKVSTEQ